MIVIQGEEINFGNMQLGKSYSKDFKIINKSSNTAKITDLGRSCSCTEVTLDSDTIPPNGQGVIHVKVTPGSNGIFLRQFWFKIISTYNIKLKGQVG